MSKAVIPIATVALEDPVTRLGRPTAWGVPQGGIVYTNQQVNATTASNTTVNFVAPPPSPEIIVDRRVMMQFQLWLTFQATPAMGVPVLQLGSNDGPRAFPLMQMINTVAATINNNTITQLQDPIIALMRANLPFSLQNREYSGSPCMLDQFQEYDYWEGMPLAQPGNGTVNTFQFQQGGGREKNPMMTYGEGMVCPTRGGFLMQVVQNPVGDGKSLQTAAIILTCTEPIFMTPFAQWGEEPGFYGIQTLNISLNLNANWWTRVWSSNINKLPYPTNASGAVTGNNVNNPGALVAPVAGGGCIANGQITGSFGQGGGTTALLPRLLFRYITPSPIKTLPPLMEYPYTSIQVYTTDAGTAASIPASGAPGGPVYVAPPPLTSNSVQFNTIPDQIIVYLARQTGDRNHLTSDTFAGISAVNINFMNQTGLLSSATPFDLYEISRKNGFDGTYDQWRYIFGSVLILRPGRDLGLEPSLAPGMNGLYNFQITVTFYNPSAAPVHYQLYILSLTSGLVTIKDNGTVTQTGIITRADVLAAQAAPSMGYHEAVKMVGGDFWGSLKSILSRGADVVSPVLHAVGKIGSYAAPFIPGSVGQFVGNVGNAATQANGLLKNARNRFGFGMYGAGRHGSGSAFEGEQEYPEEQQGLSLSSELDAPYEPERRGVVRYREEDYPSVSVSRRRVEIPTENVDPRASGMSGAPSFR